MDTRRVNDHEKICVQTILNDLEEHRPAEKQVATPKPHSNLREGNACWQRMYPSSSEGVKSISREFLGSPLALRKKRMVLLTT